MKEQKGFIQILLIIGVVVVLAVFGYLFYSKNMGAKVSSLLKSENNFTSQQDQLSDVQVDQINDPKDLDTVSTVLDAQDTTQIDYQLSQLDSISSGF